jgi:sulfate transport system permease protein
MIPISRKRRVLPGSGITLGFSLLYLSFIVLVPLSTVWLKAATEPVLQDFDAAVEEAAASLGASRWRTFSPSLASFGPRSL